MNFTVKRITLLVFFILMSYCSGLFWAGVKMTDIKHIQAVALDVVKADAELDNHLNVAYRQLRLDHASTRAKFEIPLGPFIAVIDRNDAVRLNNAEFKSQVVADLVGQVYYLESNPSFGALRKSAQDSPLGLARMFLSQAFHDRLLDFSIMAVIITIVLALALLAHSSPRRSWTLVVGIGLVVASGLGWISKLLTSVFVLSRAQVLEPTARAFLSREVDGFFKGFDALGAVGVIIAILSLAAAYLLPVDTPKVDDRPLTTDQG